MHSRARVLGQAVNPVLMLLPLGILGSAVLADLGALISGLRVFGTLAHADLVPGLFAGVLALCALLVDLLTAAPGTAPRRVLRVVCGLFGASIATFALVWSVRTGGDGGGNGGLFAVELLALASGVAGAWLARGVSLGRDLPRLALASRIPYPAALARVRAGRIPYPAALARIRTGRIPYAAALARIRGGLPR